MVINCNAGSSGILTPKTPATTGAFYFFNHPQAAPKAIRYLAPFLSSTAKLKPLFPLK